MKRGKDSFVARSYAFSLPVILYFSFSLFHSLYIFSQFYPPSHVPFSCPTSPLLLFPLLPHNLISLLQPTRIYNLHFSPPEANGAREIKLEQVMQANSFELFKEKIIWANYSFLRLADDFLVFVIS